MQQYEYVAGSFAGAISDTAWFAMVINNQIHWIHICHAEETDTAYGYMNQ